jgi:hypothetical protein
MENVKGIISRVQRMRQADPQQRKLMDVTITIDYYRSVRGPGEAVRDVRLDIPDDWYETGPWREQPNGDRWRMRDVRADRDVTELPLPIDPVSGNHRAGDEADPHRWLKGK